jgi:tetratricopeptide (TPR) repeat protein
MLQFKCLRFVGVALLGSAVGWSPALAEQLSKPQVEPAPSQAVFQSVAQFNRAAALLEQYHYRRAAIALEEVLENFPTWTPARFNLGLAYLNLEGAGSGGNDSEKLDGPQLLKRARTAFEQVLEAEPDHLAAHYLLGIYFQHVGDVEQARKHYEFVHQRDPADPHVAYKYADTLIRVGRGEEANAILQKILDDDPGFVSAVYRLAQQYLRARQRERAMPLLNQFKKLNAIKLDAGSETVGDAYGTAGKYYHALGADSLPLSEQEAVGERKVVFSPEVRTMGNLSEGWEWPGGAIQMPGIAAGDVDADGDLDLCVTMSGPGGATSIWINDGSGYFQSGQRLADAGVSAAFGDFDNDTDLDLWLGREGEDRLYTNDGAGHLSAASDGPEGSAGLTGVTRQMDVDSDGDLDLVAMRWANGSIPRTGPATAATSNIWNNNRDGTWKDTAVDLGLAFADYPVSAMSWDDFDNDRDLDLFVFAADQSLPVAWVNDRAGMYRLLDAEQTGCKAVGALSVTSGDPDKDGDRDLLVFGEAGLELFKNQGQFHFERDEGFARRYGRFGGTGGQFADMDNDGDLDIVIADARRRDGERGPMLLVNLWPADGYLNACEADAGNLLNALSTKWGTSTVVADFTGNGRCDVLLAAAGEPLRLIENVTPGGHWIQFDLLGTETADQKTRANNSAIGARVEIKTGAILQQFVVGSSSGPVAEAPLRIHAGLGDNPSVDWLRVLWPDGVLQAEVEVPAGRVTKVKELQRKTSSCPYLFAWNGKRFEFVTDFGGVGGLGYWVAPGEYARPDPTEYLRVPHLQPREGQYVLQCVTPLEEVTYLDEVKLIAVDHPLGTEVYPHEMMAVQGPPPPFEIFCVRDPIEPTRVTNHLGEDVTEELRRVDRRYAGATSPDHRFHGVAEPHWVELDFGDQLQSWQTDRRLILFLHGWVEYGYSSTNFAAYQAGIRLRAPSVHVLRDGSWVELFREVGYPAGINHWMTLDVTGKLLPTDRRIRIESNMELFWDRVFLGEHLGDSTTATSERQADEADLHFLGYPREYSPDGRQPNLCDYDNLEPGITWKLMKGRYTRFGDVSLLLHRTDNQFVVMGHGEEVTLRFAAAGFGPVPAGHRRSFVLKTNSYCKDMDLYTAHPDTVAPLPFHGMSGYPYGAEESYPQTQQLQEYQRRFNTRQVGE